MGLKIFLSLLGLVGTICAGMFLSAWSSDGNDTDGFSSSDDIETSSNQAETVEAPVEEVHSCTCNSQPVEEQVSDNVAEKKSCTCHCCCFRKKMLKLGDSLLEVMGGIALVTIIYFSFKMWHADKAIALWTLFGGCFGLSVVKYFFYSLIDIRKKLHKIAKNSNLDA